MVCLFETFSCQMILINALPFQELIPELFYLPEMLTNENKVGWIVSLTFFITNDTLLLHYAINLFCFQSVACGFFL